MPSISVIVPLFNGIRYLPYFLHSLAEAVPRNAEVIFVDDGSTEPVLDAITNELPVKSVIKLRNERNGGYSVAVNRGFAQATGEVVLQLNSDLVLEPHSIQAMLDLIDRTPKVGIVGSKQVFPTTGVLRHIGIAFGRKSIRHIYQGLPANHPLCCRTRKMQLVSGATVAMTRKVLEEIGPLDEDYYNTQENFDHCMKAHARGYENYTCAESVVYHWVSQSGPARFARVEEGDALFWSAWGAKRTVDLDVFVDEALNHVVACQPDFSRYDFEPLSLCRGPDESILLEQLERRWKNISAKIHRTNAFNSAHSTLWLPMELPYRAMMNPTPYVYLVDHFSELAENRMWFEARHRIVETELIIDTGGSALTSHELLTIAGGTLS
jgi:GT2 family glycosyltransferase